MEILTKSSYFVGHTYSDKPGTDLQGFQKSVPPFQIYRVFTESSQAPLFRFTGFLQGQARPPFSIYKVFTESSQAPFFHLQGLTESSQAPSFDLQGFYRVKPDPPYRFTGFLKSQATLFLHVTYTILQAIFTGYLQRRY